MLLKPEVIRRFEALGVESKSSKPEVLMELIKAEVGRFGKIVWETGASAD